MLQSSQAPAGGGRLTVLAVDAVEARLAPAHVLAEDVAAAALTRRLAHPVVLAGGGAARTCVGGRGWVGWLSTIFTVIAIFTVLIVTSAALPLSVSLQVSPEKPSGQMQMKGALALVTQVPPLLHTFT